MFRSLFLLVFSAIIFGTVVNCTMATKADSIEVTSTPVSFSIDKLSPEGQNAYQNLLDTEVFAQGLVGIAATLSPSVESFNTLLKEKEADAAFKSLIANAKPAGQLYALSGLYFTDQEAFQKEVKNFRQKDEMVRAMSGCEMFDEKISKIVESNDKNVAIIKPGETIEDFWKRNKVSYELDIAHGGFPATFKHYADYNKKKNGK